MASNSRMIETLLQDAVQEHSIPGLAIAVNKSGQELFAGGFGHADESRSRPVNADTIFGAASLTKFLTALLVVNAEREKRLRVSDRLSEYYPSLNCASGAPISLHHLLNHSAGFPGLFSRFIAADIENSADNTGGVDENALPADVGTWDLRNRLSTVSNLVEFLNQVQFEMLASPGSILSYSNEGFCLLGGVLEKIHTRRFSEIANNLVFEPLGMSRSSIGASRWTSRDTNLAAPLRASEGGLNSLAFWEAPLYYPAGGLMTTVRDLVILFDLLSGKNDLLSPGLVKQVTSKGMAIPSRPSGEFGYGYGLEIHQVGRKRLYWHTGQRAGISAFAGHVAEDELSIAILANVSDAPLASIAYSVFRSLLDLPGLRWPTDFKELPRSANDLTSLVGEYGSQEGFNNRVAIHQDRLQIHARGRCKDFLFSGPTYGTVGEQTFRFLNLQRVCSTQDALALDLRVFPRLS